MQKACLIIPCYNESRRLPADVFGEFLLSHPDADLLFVDDGSKDQTLDILNRIAEKNPDRVSVLALDQNRGKAEAVREGMLFASNTNKYLAVGFIDADMATPLDEWVRMWDLLRTSDTIEMVFGSRFQRLGANIVRKLSRHYLGRVFATFASLSLNLPVYDTQCGAKIFRSGFAQSVLKGAFISRWLFDVEIFHRAARLLGNAACRKRLLELPLNQWEEKAKSRVKLSDMLFAPFVLLKIHFHYRSDKRTKA